MSMRMMAMAGAVALCIGSGVLAQQARQADIDLQAAIRVETVNGNLKAAIKQYETLIARHAKDRAIVASALVRMAGCYQKLGDGESRRIYARVVSEFGDQAEAVAIARARLSVADRESTGQLSRQVWTGADVDSFGSVSADGRVITYTDWSTGNLAIHDLATGQNRRLTDNKDWSSSEYAFGSAISRDGRQVAYGWLLSAPQVRAKDDFAEVRVVDANGGTPRVVFRDPRINDVYVHDWTPDGKWLAVVLRKRDDTWLIGLVSVADGTVRVLKSVPSGQKAVSRVAVSPDGKYVAFDVSATRNDAQRQVRVMTIDAPGEEDALPHPVNDRVLGWSSDGRHLVFASDRSGLSGIWATRVVHGKLQGEPELIKANVYPKSLGMTRSGALYYAVVGSSQDIYVGSADFNAGKVIAKPAVLPTAYLGVSDFPSWSPDGKSLAYLALKNANSRSGVLSSVFVRSMGTGSVRELSHTLSYLLAPDKNRPIWGPDGAFIIVAGGDAEGRYGIYRIDAQTGATTPLVVSDRRDVSAHALSPDGRTLYLKRREPKVGQQVILARDLSSGTEREVARRERFADVVLSRDGKWLATVAFDGMSSASLLVMAADGGDARELLRASDPETLAAFVAWLPDSKTLLFRKFTKGAPRREVWRISIDGDRPREVLTGLLGPNPSIHPDGRQFAYAEGDPSLEVWTLEKFLPSVRTNK